jgi:AcrR family transcriptional regulator
VVAAAVRLAKAEGLTAVSMSRVAAELGVSTMALYRYVGSKDELLVLMVDAALGEQPVAEDSPLPWRTALERWAALYRDRLHEHPWSLDLPISGPPVAPNQTAFLERGLRALRDTGLAEHEKASIVLLVSGYVRSSAALAAQLEGFLRATPTPDEAMLGYAALLRRLTDAERFPALHAVIDAGVFDRADDPSVEFDFGLERILDGIEALIART